jgi:hypothetical protein
MKRILGLGTNRRSYRLAVENKSSDEKSINMELEINKQSHGVRGIKKFFGL